MAPNDSSSSVERQVIFDHVILTYKCGHKFRVYGKSYCCFGTDKSPLNKNTLCMGLSEPVYECEHCMKARVLGHLSQALGRPPDQFKHVISLEIPLAEIYKRYDDIMDIESMNETDPEDAR